MNPEGSTSTAPRTREVPEQPSSPPQVRLEDLADAERYRRFGELQQEMPSVWEAMQQDRAGESVVVVPSVSLARGTSTSGTMMQAMEERSLFLLLLLRQPRLRMIYVTSTPIDPSIVDYYLGLLPGVILSHARDRLTMVSVGDASLAPLSGKLLARPQLLHQIRDLIPEPSLCHLIPYNTTAMERDVALALGIPTYGCDPRLTDLGTKTGCRRIFTALGVRCPVGAEDLHDLDDIVAAIIDMREQRPGLSTVIVKINEGVSGSGNATVDVAGVSATDRSSLVAEVRRRVEAMDMEAPDLTLADYLDAFKTHGGIVEELVSGAMVTSPSVQMRARPDRSVELLSTHDQLLGGPSGQSYLGCVFPADPAYAGALAAPAMAIGQHLARLGVLGRFAVDFVAVRDDEGIWTTYAIELNLRKGGTTHPFLTLQFLTDGSYDGERGTFETPQGQPKHLVATDHFEDERLRVLTVGDLFDLAVRHHLHFDQSRQTGVVFHMMSGLTECGRLGITAVGDGPDEARELYETTRRAILDEAGRALAEGTVLA